MNDVDRIRERAEHRSVSDANEDCHRLLDEIDRLSDAAAAIIRRAVVDRVMIDPYDLAEALGMDTDLIEPVCTRGPNCRVHTADAAQKDGIR